MFNFLISFWEFDSFIVIFRLQYIIYNFFMIWLVLISVDYQMFLIFF